MSKNETPLTRAYWRALGKGVLYEELRVTHAVPGEQSWRDVDGVVVLNGEHRIASPHERLGLSLDGKDAIVIQTKATPLNPYVFGQALLSMDLIRMRWSPQTLRSVLICGADDAELRPVVDRFPDIEVRVSHPDRLSSFRLGRLHGAAAQLARERDGLFFENAQLTSRFRIDGLVIPSLTDRSRPSLTEAVAGRKVTSIHSEASGGRPKNLGMWVAGEVIAAQQLLLRMGATAVDSVVLCRRGDRAVEAALRRYARFEVVPHSSTARLPMAPRSSPRLVAPTSSRSRQLAQPATAPVGVATVLQGRRNTLGAAPGPSGQGYIPGRYCPHCGWPFTAGQQGRSECQAKRACKGRQQTPLHLRGQGNDRVHPEWLALRS